MKMNRETIRISDHEKELIMDAMKSHGYKNRSQFLRESIISGIHSVPPEHISNLYVELDKLETELGNHIKKKSRMALHLNPSKVNILAVSKGVAKIIEGDIGEHTQIISDATIGRLQRKIWNIEARIEYELERKELANEQMSWT